MGGIHGGCHWEPQPHSSLDLVPEGNALHCSFVVLVSLASWLSEIWYSPGLFALQKFRWTAVASGWNAYSVEVRCETPFGFDRVTVLPCSFIISAHCHSCPALLHVGCKVWYVQQWCIHKWFKRILKQRSVFRWTGVTGAGLFKLSTPCSIVKLKSAWSPCHLTKQIALYLQSTGGNVTEKWSDQKNPKTKPKKIPTL